ncbi:MAG: DNA-directed RNA polymerase subunit omega [Phycisphaerae bacterium]|nr:DNA-directed RNA polymerase subunit omega [Phycisphaerae bacterium]
MIDELRNEDIIEKVGGRFKLTALIQKRWRELMFGARPMIEPGNMTPMEVAIKEIMQDKIALNMDEPESDEPAES